MAVGDWAAAALLNEPALQRVIEAAGIPVAASVDVKAACSGVLEQVARQAVVRAFDGTQLSKRRDLEPLLKAWRRWRDTRSPSAKDRLSELTTGAADKRFGPIPPPLTHPDAFESWLADMSLAHRVAPKLVEESLTPAALANAQDKDRRVAKARQALHPAAGPKRDLLRGGRPAERERDRRTEMLLAVFWLLFAEKPTASIADTHPRPHGDAFQATAADGGAAVRFIVAFEAEVAVAIVDHQISDPLRKRPRPCRWEVHSEHNVSQQIERLIERRGRVWEQWALQADADRSPAAMLVRVS